MIGKEVKNTEQVALLVAAASLSTLFMFNLQPPISGVLHIEPRPESGFIRTENRAADAEDLQPRKRTSEFRSHNDRKKSAVCLEDYRRRGEYYC